MKCDLFLVTECVFVPSVSAREGKMVERRGGSNLWGLIRYEMSQFFFFLKGLERQDEFHGCGCGMRMCWNRWIWFCDFYFYRFESFKVVSLKLIHLSPRVDTSADLHKLSYNLKHPWIFIYVIWRQIDNLNIVNGIGGSNKAAIRAQVSIWACVLDNKYHME